MVFLPLYFTQKIKIISFIGLQVWATAQYCSSQPALSIGVSMLDPTHKHDTNSTWVFAGQGWVINGSTRKQHDKKRVISGSTNIIRNRHVLHVNLFVSTRNDPLNTIRLTRITNKYSFYFRFVKYLLYPTYIIKLKKKK